MPRHILPRHRRPGLLAAGLASVLLAPPFAPLALFSTQVVAGLAVRSQRVVDLPFERVDLPALSPDGGRVVFSGTAPDGRSHLYVQSLDGGTPATPLTSGDGNEWSARWSPDGERIAFVSDRTGQRDLFIVPARGGEAKRITSDPSDDIDPEWSPDGTRLVFASRRGGPLLLYIVLLSDLQVYPFSAGTGHDRRPAWSSDGRHIAFESTRDRAPRIWIMPADGGEARRLTASDAADESWPCWMPGDEALAFLSSPREAPPRLWVAPLAGDSPASPATVTPPPGSDPAAGAPVPSFSRDGSLMVAVGGGRASLEVLPVTGGTPATVLHHDRRLHHPAWARNGRQIVLSSDMSGEWDLYLAGISSGRLTRLTTDDIRQVDPVASPVSDDIAYTVEEAGGSALYLLEPQSKRTIRLSAPAAAGAPPARDAEPAWSPDGRQIAFSSDRAGHRDLYIVPSGGGEVKRLTAFPGSESHPTWSPDGQWIAFARDQGSGSEIWKLPVAGGEPVAITRGGEAAAGDYQPVWSPAGTWIAFTRKVGETGVGSDLYIIPPDGGKPFPFRRGAGEVRIADPAFSPDGKHLAWSYSRLDRLILYSTLPVADSGAPQLQGHPGTPGGPRPKPKQPPEGEEPQAPQPEGEEPQGPPL